MRGGLRTAPMSTHVHAHAHTHARSHAHCRPPFLPPPGCPQPTELGIKGRPEFQWLGTESSNWILRPPLPPPSDTERLTVGMLTPGQNVPNPLKKLMLNSVFLVPGPASPGIREAHILTSHTLSYPRCFRRTPPQNRYKQSRSQLPSVSRSNERGSTPSASRCQPGGSRTAL